LSLELAIRQIIAVIFKQILEGRCNRIPPKPIKSSLDSVVVGSRDVSLEFLGFQIPLGVKQIAKLRFSVLWVEGVLSARQTNYQALTFLTTEVPPEA